MKKLILIALMFVGVQAFAQNQPKLPESVFQNSMSIKKDNPKRRKSFRARHGCDKGTLDKLKAKYWSCKAW